VTIVLHAHLARYRRRSRSRGAPASEGLAIAGYLRKLGIPEHEYYAVVRGGKTSKDLGAVLAAGEVIELLPAMSGG